MTEKTDGTLDDDCYVYEDSDLENAHHSQEVIRIGVPEIGPGSETPVLDFTTGSPHAANDDDSDSPKADEIPHLGIPRLFGLKNTFSLAGGASHNSGKKLTRTARYFLIYANRCTFEDCFCTEATPFEGCCDGKPFPERHTHVKSVTVFANI